MSGSRPWPAHESVGAKQSIVVDGCSLKIGDDALVVLNVCNDSLVVVIADVVAAVVVAAAVVVVLVVVVDDVVVVFVILFNSSKSSIVCSTLTLDVVVVVRVVLDLFHREHLGTNTGRYVDQKANHNPSSHPAIDFFFCPSVIAPPVNGIAGQQLIRAGEAIVWGPLVRHNKLTRRWFC